MGNRVFFLLLFVFHLHKLCQSVDKGVLLDTDALWGEMRAEMRGLKTIVSRQEATIKAQTAVISNLVDTVSRQGAQIARLEGNKSPNTSDPPSNNTLDSTKCRTRRVQPETMVAFQAMKMNTQTGIGTNQNILFEKVSLNLGNGYHPQHGIFIVPRSGIYVISAATLHDPQQGIYFNGAIEHQGNAIAYLFGDANEWEQSSQTVLIQANAGDEIWVRNTGPANENIHGGAFSTFSGYLLWEN